MCDFFKGTATRRSRLNSRTYRVWHTARSRLNLRKTLRRGSRALGSNLRVAREAFQSSWSLPTPTSGSLPSVFTQQRPSPPGCTKQRTVLKSSRIYAPNPAGARTSAPQGTAQSESPLIPRKSRKPCLLSMPLYTNARSRARRKHPRQP